jgi:hypothetical protein
LLENGSDELTNTSQVPPRGPCGAFGAGQPCNSALVFEMVRSPAARYVENVVLGGICGVRWDFFIPPFLLLVRYVWPGSA